MEQYLHFGIMFGYPECCIDSFNKGRYFATMTDEEKAKHRSSVFHHSGFIPCKSCSEKDPKEVLREIDSRRYKVVEVFLPYINR